MWGAGSDKISLLTRLCNEVEVPLAAKILHHDPEAIHIVASLVGEVFASCRSLQKILRDCRVEVTVHLFVVAVLNLSSRYVLASG